MTPIYRLAVLGGSGDAFLVCGLLAAFKRQHGVSDVRLVLRARLAAVARLYGLDGSIEIDDGLIGRAEQDSAFQASYPNDLLVVDRVFYVHPCFLRTPARVDVLTTYGQTSQAAMYRMLLGLPVDTPVEIPPYRFPARPAEPDAVVVVPEANSWPNSQPDFWPRLVERLLADGWDVHVNNKVETLDTLLERCKNAAWVIGPQCGVMAILASGEFPCRKTIATPNLDGNLRPEYLARETFPYGYVTKFADRDYDVEEFKIGSNHDALIERIATGVNARRLWSHDPRPVTTITAPLSPGDFVDRLAVLTVKMEKFDAPRRAAIRREHDRFAEIARQMPIFPAEFFDRLVDLHRKCYELLARIVPGSVDDAALGIQDHVVAIRINKDRVELKLAIDAALHAPYGEVKDYYQRS